MRRIIRFASFGILSLGLAAGLAAQAQPQPAPAPLARSVRLQLGRANVDEARRQIQASRESAAKKAIATALVAIYEGKDEDARKLLEPLSQGDAADDDAVLELGLIEMRRGRKDAGGKLLSKIIDLQSDRDTDGFMLVARAATAMGDVTLANSVFQRIGPSEMDRPDVQTAWGDLFFETHANAEAARSYQDALKADAVWIPALVGSARALADDDRAAAIAALTKAQQLAPKSPEVWLLTAERQIAAQDFVAAKASLDKVAAARPGTVEELALRASVTYAGGTAKDVEPFLAQARALNPSSTKVLRAVASQAAQLYRFDDAVTFSKLASAADDEVAGPHADLGMYLLRTGDEEQARVELERAFKIDPYDTVTFNLLQMLDSLEKFTVIKDGEFIFKFSPESASVMKPYAIPLAQAAYKELSARYEIKPQGPILIEVFDQHDSFAVRTLGLPGITGALGACFGRVIAMDSPKARPPGDFSWQATMWHEIAHVFTLQKSKYRVPRWLTEGISQYEEHRRSAPWGRELTMQYARAMAQNETFGVKKLGDGFKNPERLGMAYFEASLVVEHLEALGGVAALRTLLTSYADGATDTEAFAKAFGKTIDEAETSFRAFTESKYGAMRDALKDPPTRVGDDDLPALKARADANPGNYISQVSYAIAAMQAQQTAPARAAFERAAALVPFAGGDDGPFAMLATLAAQAGDNPAARKYLSRVLDLDHDNIAAARTLATLATESKNEAELDFALMRLADLDPFEGDTHTQLGRRELAKGNAPRAIVEFEAAIALGPPNQAEARTDLGEAYLKAGRKDDAKREAFLALEQAPTFARAQDLLLAALGKSAPPALGGGVR
jgi:tetratricopeptide (TPR) repeat protein